MRIEDMAPAERAEAIDEALHERYRVREGDWGVYIEDTAYSEDAITLPWSEFVKFRNKLYAIEVPWMPPTKPSEQLRDFIRIGNLPPGQTTPEERSWWKGHSLSGAVGRDYDEWTAIVANWLEGLGQ